ncbi:hypothetical protein CTI12_AA521570 [Artemisia annua]|uniref:Uncharacterized protein n=1 Tax=Artemisia annua TaxID=35608 RepID=A0A2U1L7L5_ARTAN|nr:hypothetical protein CTI12_AA521570 [Artemisia annua]
MFCFTSFGARIDHSVNNGRAPYTFRISGQNYHLLGSLLPEVGVQPKYCQLYFFDTDNEVRYRMNAFINNEESEIDERIVASLIDMLNQSSSVAMAFRMARDWCNSHNSNNFQLRLLGKRSSSRQYNAPTVAEVAALITNDFGEGISIRDIIMIEYVKEKYGYSWLESDEMSDEMFEDLCRFAKEEEVIKDTNSKGKEVDASHAQPVSTLGNKSPKPSKMDTNVVLGLLAAKWFM